MKKIYLDEFVNIAVHHLVRGNSKNLFQFIWSKNFIRSSLGCLSISLNASTYLPLALLARLALLMTRVDLVNR